MSAAYIAIFIVLMVILIQHRNARVWVKQLITSRKKGDKTEMLKLAERFIEKECIVYTFNSQLEGIIREVSESAVLIERSGGTVEAVNLDFVVRIREYPKKKNGKRKSVVLD